MRAVPLATYKDDNDFGTWFRKVLGLVRQIAGPVATVAFGPAAGGAVTAAAAAIGRAVADRQKARNSTAGQRQPARQAQAAAVADAIVRAAANPRRRPAQTGRRNPRRI